MSKNYFKKRNGENFLNLFNDMTFKRIFRTEEDKGLLIAFLNTIFEGKRTIVDVTHRNVEVQHPFLDDGRGCVFNRNAIRIPKLHSQTDALLHVLFICQ